MSRSAKFLFLFLVIIFSNYPSNAIDFSRPVSLQECIEYAQENSLAAEIAKREHISRQASYKSTKAAFLPQLSLNVSAPGLVREINEITLPDGTSAFRQQSQLFSSGSLMLQQRLPFSGTTIQASSNISRLDLLEPGIQTWRTSPFQIGIVQPLFQPNQMKWDKRLSELEYKKSDQEYAEDMEALAIEVTRRFFDFYIAEMNEQNAQFNVAINDTLFRLSRGRLDVGRIDSNDYLQTELSLLNSQNEHERAKLTYRQSMEQLKKIIGYKGYDEISVMPPPEHEFFTVEPDRAIREAFENRAVIIEQHLREARSKRTLESEEAQGSVNATLTASYGLNQSASQIDDAYKQLLDRERLDLNLSIPLFDWGKNNAEVEMALQNYKSTVASIKEEKESIMIDIKYEALQFNRLQTQVALSAKADTIAAKSFEIAKKRYLIGKIDLNTFFISQRDKDSALRSYIQTLRDYWTSYYSLRRLTLYDFRERRKIIYEMN